MQAAVETVVVDDDVGRYCVALAVATRAHTHVQLGASPRGALALLLCGRAHAVIAGRDYVTPEDVKAVAPSVLAHRITVKPELWLTKASGTTVTDEVLAAVPTPTPDGGPHREITDRWRPTPAHVRAVLVGLLCRPRCSQRRPDLLVIAGPFVGRGLGRCCGRPHRPSSSRIGHTTVREGEATTWQVGVDDAEGLSRMSPWCSRPRP